MVFFCLLLYGIFPQYFFNGSIFVKYIFVIYPIKFLIFIKGNKILFKNLRAPPFGFVSKKTILEGRISERFIIHRMFN